MSASSSAGDGKNAAGASASHLLSGIRHDLSSPLTVIRGHGQLLRLRVDDLGVPEQERERIAGHLDAIEEAVDRIVAMLYPETGDDRGGRSGHDGAGGAR